MRIASTILLALLMAAPALGQSTFTVTTTNDAGAGSLRQAILDANANPGADVIAFTIPGSGPHTIQPLSALPAATGPVTIDGLTQPGADCSTWPATLQVELDGSNAGSGADGLTLSGGSSTVRGLVINRFAQATGIVVDSDANAVACNYLGTDVTGTMAPGGPFGHNDDGVLIDGGSDNVIGGAASSMRNLIANNDGYGIILDGGATGNVIAGNFFGTDVHGAVALENGNAGIYILDAPGNTIGGADHAAGVCNNSCNLISGSDTYAGIRINPTDSDSADDTVIQGNFIGTDLTGTVAISNGDSGIDILAFGGAADVEGLVIGGSTDPGVCSEACNLISGNDEHGIFNDDSDGAVIQGNFIGTDATGMAALPNGQDGIDNGGDGAVIGGPSPGLGNLISGNEDAGLDVGSDDTVIQGNLIGVAVDGTTPLGNGEAGISLNGSNTLVGGTAPGDANVIAYNGGIGIFTGGTSSAGNLFSGNALFENGGLGIELCVVVDFQCDGATANDPGDGDEGPNRLQNHPELASATGDGIALTVAYVVPTATANAAYPLRVEFFLADADGEEGRAFIGSDTYEAADAEQQASATFSPAASIFDGDRVLATATDADGNTSEFGAAVTVEGNAVATEPGAEVPTGFALSAAYPNPFNPATVLSLDLPEAGTVTVAVYDALGRRMAVLYDGVLTAGSHTLRFAAAGLPSGLYVVRASGLAGAVSRRVTLVR